MKAEDSKRGTSVANQRKRAKLENKLGTWVTNQRKTAKLGKLRQDRKELLQEIEFSWSLYSNVNQNTENKKYLKHDKRWNEMFQKLKKYHSEHGDCKVPYSYPKDPVLGNWVSTQRRVLNKKTYLYGDQKEMHQGRKNLLASLGFDSSSQLQKKNDGTKEDWSAIFEV